jgi:hypothetical protein
MAGIQTLAPLFICEFIMVLPFRLYKKNSINLLYLIPSIYNMVIPLH